MHRLPWQSVCKKSETLEKEDSVHEPHAHAETEGVDPDTLQRFLLRGPSPGVRAGIRFGFLSLLGGALVFVLHGAAFHLTPWSQVIVNGIAKYWYPSFGQKDTTVVLFREENLERLNETYPISYLLHADVLDAIKTYEPRAVFVDFVFLDKARPGSEAKRRREEDSRRLKEAICGLSRSGASPVYLAVDEGHSGIAEELAVGGRSCIIKVTPDMEDAFGVSGVLTYAHGVETHEGFLPTPAFALAINNKQGIPNLCPERKQGTIPCAEDLAPMEILWGNNVAPLNTKWMQSCEPEPWWKHLWDSLHHHPLHVKRGCPYTQTISVWHLLESLRSGDPDVRNAIQGKTVLYGAGFQMAGDIVTSPVFRDLPAVYLHAMAYDNLRTFGAEYKRAERELSLSSHALVIPLSLLIDAPLLLLIVAVILFIDKLLAKLRRVPSWMKCAALAAGLAIIPIAFIRIDDVQPWAQVFVPTLWWIVFFGVPMLVGIASLIDIAQFPRHSETTSAFTAHLIFAIVIVSLGTVAFLTLAIMFGLDTAILVVLPTYFVYKLLVARDAEAVAMSVLLAIASASRATSSL